MQSFQPRGPPPTSKSFIDTLPKISIDDPLQKEQHRCPVCLIDYELDEEVLKLPCKHVYHEECITTWLNQANTCCVCRHELPKHEEAADSSTSHPFSLTSSNNSQELTGTDPFSQDAPFSLSSSSASSQSDDQAFIFNDNLPPLVDESELEQEIQDELGNLSLEFLSDDSSQSDAPFEDIPVESESAQPLTAQSSQSPLLQAPQSNVNVNVPQPHTVRRTVDDDLPNRNRRSSGPSRWFQDRFRCFFRQ